MYRLQALHEVEIEVGDPNRVVRDTLLALMNQVTEEQWSAALEHAVTLHQERQHATCWSADQEFGS